MGLIEPLPPSPPAPMLNGQGEARLRQFVPFPNSSEAGRLKLEGLTSETILLEGALEPNRKPPFTTCLRSNTDNVLPTRKKCPFQVIVQENLQRPRHVRDSLVKFQVSSTRRSCLHAACGFEKNAKVFGLTHFPMEVDRCLSESCTHNS